MRAFAVLRAEQAAGRRPCFSVNLSGSSVGAPEVLALIEAEIAPLQHPWGALILEVTETEAVVNLERARCFAERLKAMGCRMALDDFGSGYASFAYLKQLPFDVLKIDGQFVRGLVGSAEDQAVVTALVTIARALGMETVAEFVEDEETPTCSAHSAWTRHRATTSDVPKPCPSGRPRRSGARSRHHSHHPLVPTRVSGTLPPGMPQARDGGPGATLVGARERLRRHSCHVRLGTR